MEKQINPACACESIQAKHERERERAKEGKMTTKMSGSTCVCFFVYLTLDVRHKQGQLGEHLPLQMQPHL